MACDGAHAKGCRISVLIVADVRLYREGLAGSLASREHLTVIGTSATRPDALAHVTTLRPDVVIVDTAMRESLDLIRQMRREQVPAKILAFAVDEASSDVLDCAEAGANGYVTTDSSVDDLVLAIERIAREELVCSPRVAAQLFGRMSRDPARPVGLSKLQVLTIRERQVLELIHDGCSNKEIALKLSIAEPTVKNHVHHLLEKLEVTSRAQAVARATLTPTRRRPFDPSRLPSSEVG